MSVDLDKVLPSLVKDLVRNVPAYHVPKSLTLRRASTGTRLGQVPFSWGSSEDTVWRQDVNDTRWLAYLQVT